MELVTVELETLDELLHRPFRLERQQRQAVRDIPPLSRLFRESEPLAELLDDILCLFLLLDEREDVFHDALEGLFVHRMGTYRQVTDNCNDDGVSDHTQTRRQSGSYHRGDCCR